MGNLLKWVVFSVIVLLIIGCGSGTQETKSGVATEQGETVTSKQEARAERTDQAQEQVSAAAVSAEKAEDAPTVSVYQRTKEMDWSVTPERRAAIEEAIPDAKGFIDGTELVQKIIDENIRGRENRAAVFEEAAAGKYVYFAAQTNPNPFNANASLNLIFGEGAFGPDFMQVQLTAPEGYINKEYLEKFGGTGYVTAFVGKLTVEESRLTLAPVFDVYLPGYMK